MTTLSFTVPVAGSDLNSVADAQVSTALTATKAWANGNIDANNLTAGAAQSAAVNQSGQTVKGAVSISASESRTNTAYGTLTTPDQVTGIVLATNGKLIIDYQAMWQESVAGAGRAAIFIGSNQLVVQSTASLAPVAEAAATNVGTPAINHPLFTVPIGLASLNTSGGFAADATTGQAIGVYAASGIIAEVNGTNVALGNGTGGPCEVFAAAGTYTISVQFKASSGSVTASNRKLWVEARSYG